MATNTYFIKKVVTPAAKPPVMRLLYSVPLAARPGVQPEGTIMEHTVEYDGAHRQSSVFTAHLPRAIFIDPGVIGTSEHFRLCTMDSKDVNASASSETASVMDEWKGLSVLDGIPEDVVEFFRSQRPADWYASNAKAIQDQLVVAQQKALKTQDPERIAEKVRNSVKIDNGHLDILSKVVKDPTTGVRNDIRHKIPFSAAVDVLARRALERAYEAYGIRHAANPNGVKFPSTPLTRIPVTQFALNGGRTLADTEVIVTPELFEQTQEFLKRCSKVPFNEPKLPQAASSSKDRVTDANTVAVAHDLCSFPWAKKLVQQCAATSLIYGKNEAGDARKTSLGVLCYLLEAPDFHFHTLLGRRLLPAKSFLPDELYGKNHVSTDVYVIRFLLGDKKLAVAPEQKDSKTNIICTVTVSDSLGKLLLSDMAGQPAALDFIRGSLFRWIHTCAGLGIGHATASMLRLCDDKEDSVISLTDAQRQFNLVAFNDGQGKVMAESFAESSKPKPAPAPVSKSKPTTPANPRVSPPAARVDGKHDKPGVTPGNPAAAAPDPTPATAPAPAPKAAPQSPPKAVIASPAKKRAREAPIPDADSQSGDVVPIEGFPPSADGSPKKKRKADSKESNGVHPVVPAPASTPVPAPAPSKVKVASAAAQALLAEASVQTEPMTDHQETDATLRENLAVLAAKFQNIAATLAARNKTLETELTHLRLAAAAHAPVAGK